MCKRFYLTKWILVRIYPLHILVNLGPWRRTGSKCIKIQRRVVTKAGVWK